MTAPTLDYDNPPPPSPERYLRYAKKCSGWGFLLPIFGLVGIGFGIATWVQPTLTTTQRKSGLFWAGIGIVSTFINPLICFAALVLTVGAPRPLENMEKCASHLRFIGQAIKMYAYDYRGSLPSDPQSLLATQDITIDVFICPSSKHDNPVPGGGPTSVIEGTSTCSYLFYRFPNQKLGQLPPNAILVFEKDCFHTPANQGMNVLHADGSTTTLTEAQAKIVMRELMTGQNPPPSLSASTPAP